AAPASSACSAPGASTSATSAAPLRPRHLRPSLFGAGVVGQRARPHGAVIVCKTDAMLIFEHAESGERELAGRIRLAGRGAEARGEARAVECRCLRACRRVYDHEGTAVPDGLAVSELSR